MNQQRTDTQTHTQTHTHTLQWRPEEGVMFHCKLPQSLGHLQAGQSVRRRLMWLFKLHSNIHNVYSN